MHPSSRFCTVAMATVLLTALALNAFAGGQITDFADEYSSSGTVIVVPPFSGSSSPFQVCSGTLIHPRVFMTAGHCAYQSRNDTEFTVIRVSIGVDAYDPDNWHEVEALIIHPDYVPGRGFRTPGAQPGVDNPDIAMLVLKEPVTHVTPATLAPKGFLDDLKELGLLFGEEVSLPGYGQEVTLNPHGKIEPDGLRDVACPPVQGLRRTHLVVKQVVAGEHVGMCGGDSGSPTFWTNPDGSRLLVAMYTAASSNKCLGVGFCYRMDQASSLDFIDSVLDDVDAGFYD